MAAQDTEVVPKLVPGVGDTFTGTYSVVDLWATISNLMWGRGIAPGPK